MSALRSELLGETVPEWSIAIPEGWQRHTVTDETRDLLTSEGRSRLMAVHRPDLYGQLVDATTQAFREMRRLDTVAMFIPGPETPPHLFLPASITAAVRRGSNGASLDDEVAHLIRTRGATALDADKRFVRFVAHSARRADQPETTTVVYLTPIPDSARRRALQFTLVLAHDSAERGDAEWVAGVCTLVDAHVSTFGWRNP